MRWPWTRKPESTPRRTAARSFEAAAISRLTASWQGSTASLNEDLRGQLDRLRARSRDACQNNELAARFMQLVVDNTVGPQGFTLLSRATDANGTLDKQANDAIEWAWWHWQQHADIAGRLRFVDMLRVLVRHIVRDGEGLLVMYVDKGRLRLRLIDPAALDHTHNVSRTATGTRIVMGVELDDMGRRVAYHFRRNGQAGHERIPARDVIHAFMPLEADQVRGVPWMHAVLRRMHDLNGYREAAVIAARTGAAKMGIWTIPEDGLPPGETDKNGTHVTDAEPGHFDFAPAGYKLDAWDPAYPHDQFDSFCKEAIRGIASGVSVSYPSLASDLSDVNFSSIRAGELQDRDHWMVLQDWLAASVLYHIHGRWLDLELLGARIRLPNGAALPASKRDKFAEHVFQGRRWAWVDPLKDMNAAIAAMNSGLDSPQNIAARQGRDVEDVLDDIAAFQAMCDVRGIRLGSLQFAPMPTETET